MGKSPGKWIKTVLFGKKLSKSSNSSKNAAKIPVENRVGNPPHVTDLPYQLTDRDKEKMQLENSASDTRNTGGLQYDNLDSQINIVPVPSSDAEMSRQEKAATKLQAVFRGYLAGRAFRALKGIIRLQALVRGHLVRRQSVATLRCMLAIVRLQALARGRRVRLSETMLGECRKFNSARTQDAKQMEIGSNSYLGPNRLANNMFVCKILASMPTAMPLCLRYDLDESNSAWNWLERWSVAHLRKSSARSQNVTIKPQKKQGATQNVELGTGKSKRSIRKVLTAGNGDASAIASAETDKLKRNPRKIISHQTEFVQEQPQSELERVKHNLRKVSASAAANSVSELEADKPLPQPRSVMKMELNTAIPEPKLGVSSETPDNHALVDEPSKATVINEQFDTPQNDHPIVELHSYENGGKMENSQITKEESKEELVGKENHKVRRKSLTVKQEQEENIMQNPPSLPSYMAATESAKAKLRPQGSSKLDEDDADNGYVRRHSLPASTNGKSSSFSPRVPKSVQANGKGGAKTNKSSTNSRDDKMLQPGWRR